MYKNRSLQLPHLDGQSHSVPNAMDPAGYSSCAQDHHNGDESNTHTLDSTGPEAHRGLTDDKRQGPRTDYGLQPTEAGLREEKAAEIARKNKDQYGWRRVIRNFTPSYT